MRGVTKGRTSTRSGCPTAGRCCSSPIATASRTCTARRVDGGDVGAGDAGRHGNQRHHRDRARRCRSRRAPASPRSASTRAGKYNIYTLVKSVADSRRPRPPRDRRQCCRRGSAAQRGGGAAAERAARPARRRAATRAFRTSRSSSLEGLAQPTVGVGASRFGTAIGGGIAFQFGDMLGESHA